MQEELSSLTGTLSVTTSQLQGAESTKQKLLEEVQRTVAAKEEADSNLALLNDHHAQLEKTYGARLEELEQNIATCSEERDRLKVELAEVTATLNQTRFTHQQEVKKLQEELVEERERVVQVEEERKQTREELSSMHGMVAQETESLRFQLSTTSMQLQKTTQVWIGMCNIFVIKVHTNLYIHVLTAGCYDYLKVTINNSCY